MTKADLVEEVIRVAVLSKKDAENVVNTVFGQIMEALKIDDKIELRGFGSFRVRRRRSRLGRNPKTGDRVDVPSKRIPYFKPGKELRDLINGHDGETLPRKTPARSHERTGGGVPWTPGGSLLHRDVGMSDERPRRRQDVGGARTARLREGHRSR
jgi:integration host factor subunit beta